MSTYKTAWKMECQLMFEDEVFTSKESKTGILYLDATFKSNRTDRWEDCQEVSFDETGEVVCLGLGGDETESYLR